MGRASLASRMMTMRILFGAMLASLGLFAVVLYVVTGQPPAQQPPTFADQQVFFYALCGAGVGVLVALVIVRGKTMPPQISAAATVDFTKPLSIAASTALARMFSASLLTWAMAESIALFGFIFGFIIHDDWPYYPFLLVAIAVDLLCAPSRRLVEGIIAAADAGQS